MANKKVMFFADVQCAPCKAIKPLLEQFCVTYKVPFESYEAGESREAFWTWKVKGTPTILVVEDGKEIDRIIGHQNYNSIDCLFQKWGLTNE